MIIDIHTEAPLLKNISVNLNVRVIGVERLTGAYNSTKNIFKIKTISKKGIRRLYFLKFNRDKDVGGEIGGIKFIGDVVNTPKVILFSKIGLNEKDKWILFEYIDGILMSNKFCVVNKRKELNSFLKLEIIKERKLSRLHSLCLKKINYNQYLKARTNKLFYKRFIGKRFHDFYCSHDNVSSLFDRKFYINGRRMSATINQLIADLKNKYKNNELERVPVIMGHGDAHHGNILVNDDIWFIDNEYAGYVTPFMEVAKPYYNDFIGSLFFHNQKELKKCFKLTKFLDDGENIFINVKMSKIIVKYVAITNVKLSERKYLVNKETKDFLSLNDYLLLCHLLTKNPNFYSSYTQKLFLIFCLLLASFDPFKPESIYKYF